MKRFICILIFLAGIISIHAKNYYVSNSGSDDNDGNINDPFKTVQYAINRLNAGDTLFIRSGTYHESISIKNLVGSENLPVIITNYNNEEVLFDGTIPIESHWELYKGNIYKTIIPEDIWQLFVDERMQVIARWPNAQTHPCDKLQLKPINSWEPEDGTWWSKETTWANADMPGTVAFDKIENNPEYHNLAATGLSFTGGSVIYSFLEQGGDGNQERRISSHQAGSNFFTHPSYSGPGIKNGYLDVGKFYIIEHLEALDQAEEWYYTPADKTLYLWTDNGAEPTNRNIRGRNIRRAITIENSSYISIKGIQFFAGNFGVIQSDYITLEDCNFSYPDASQRLLGIYPEDSDNALLTYGTSVEGEHFSMINCEFKYSETGIYFFRGYYSRLHNNLFHHISMLGIGKDGAFEMINTFTRNTFHTAGQRTAVKTNTIPEAGRIHSWNIIGQFGFLQVPDGSALQANPARTPGTERAYNWFLSSSRRGSRWDGDPGGINGLNHHQVGYNTHCVSTVKGDFHKTYNNSAILDLRSGGGGNLEIRTDKGGNPNSETANNAVDKLNENQKPVPGINTNNWDCLTNGSSMRLLLRDPDNLDFRPVYGSPLINAGIEIDGITDGFIDQAPDIGAYEYGDTMYWIPGRLAKKASVPIPPDNSLNVKSDVNLMWLKGIESVSHNVYFGKTETSLQFLTNKSNPGNIVDPGIFGYGPEPDSTYYWRVDAVMQNGNIVKGEVWKFTTGETASNAFYEVNFIIKGVKDLIVFSLDSVSVQFDNSSFTTDQEGNAKIKLSKGNNEYSLGKNGYLPKSGSIFISSDTTIIDTLEFTTYDVIFRLNDRDTGEPLHGCELNFNSSVFTSPVTGIIEIQGVEYNNYDILVSREGYISLEIKDIEIYSDTILNFLLVHQLTTIPENYNSFNITVFPNPANKNIFIESGVPEIEMQIISMNGTIIGYQKLKQGINSYDISRYEKGALILKFISGNSVFYTKLIIK